MALFKPMYGSNETALNAKNLVEGYCWFTTDDGKFYVDTKNSSGVLSRILLNAGKADQLATARTIRTNLGSTATASFNGTANITPGVTGILPITNGGTGADNVDSARHNLTNLGINVITTTTNDTVAKWGAYKGLGFSMYTKTGQLNDQPSQYGLLLNIGHSTSEVHQLWLTQSHGNIYHRGGNANGWGTQSWVAMLDSHNYNTYVPKKDGTGATGTWGISISGNASSASSLQVPQALTTDELIDNFLAANTFQVAIWNNTSSPGVTNGTIISGGWNNTTYGWQLAIDDDPTYYMALRQKSTTWGAWKRIPMGDGTGASGTWGISITGNAGAASQLNAYNTPGEYTKNTLAYFNSSLNHSGTAQVGVNDGPTTTNTWWHFLRFTHSNGAGYYTDLAVPFNANSLYYKRIANGSVQNASTNAGWVQVLDALNYTTYCAPASHSHSYLPLSGGTLTGLLTISTNNRYVVLGCQNEGYAHYSTNADTGHWFNKSVSVQGDIYCGSSYNTKVYTVDGGTLNNTAQIIRNGRSTSWITGRDTAIVRANTYNNYSAGLSMKTANGSWEIGVYTDDNMWFTYASDANYNAGTNSVTQFRASSAGVIYGAAWNDYAEYRQGQKEYKPGTCVIEVGDDTLVASTERLQSGALIVSDTFGFAIGETDEAKTPIATSGRVLAYTFEPRESYSAGDPVCSGPNGTISKMTEQEVMMYPHKMIGTVSAIPDYEEWGTGKVKVDGRIWI